MGVSRLDGKEDEIRRFLKLGRLEDRHRQDHRRVPYCALQLHDHQRAQAEPFRHGLLVVCHRNNLTVQLQWARHGGLKRRPKTGGFAVLSVTGGDVKPFRRRTTSARLAGHRGSRGPEAPSRTRAGPAAAGGLGRRTRLTGGRARSTPASTSRPTTDLRQPGRSPKPPSSGTDAGKRGQQGARWLERHGGRAVRPRESQDRTERTGAGGNGVTSWSYEPSVVDATTSISRIEWAIPWRPSTVSWSLETPEPLRLGVLLCRSWVRRRSVPVAQPAAVQFRPAGQERSER